MSVESMNLLRPNSIESYGALIHGTDMMNSVTLPDPYIEKNLRELSSELNFLVFKRLRSGCLHYMKRLVYVSLCPALSTFTPKVVASSVFFNPVIITAGAVSCCVMCCDFWRTPPQFDEQTTCCERAWKVLDYSCMSNTCFARNIMCHDVDNQCNLDCSNEESNLPQGWLIENLSVPFRWYPRILPNCCGETSKEKRIKHLIDGHKMAELKMFDDLRVFCVDDNTKQWANSSAKTYTIQPPPMEYMDVKPPRRH